MEKVLENVVPQASNLDNEENLAIVSDRVKAPVGDAGSTDFGGSQKHDVANQAGTVGVGRLALTLSQKTSEEVEAPNVDPQSALPKTARKTKKPSAWEEHEQLIAGLVEHLNEKMPDGKTRRTVTAETRKLVDEIQKSFTQIRKLMRAAPKTIISKTAVPDKQTVGEVNQRAQKPCSVQNELFQSPGNANWYRPLQETPKRKERSPPSPNVKQAEKKASLGQKPQQLALPGLEQTQDEKPSQTAPNEDQEMEEWQTVAGKGRKAKRKERQQTAKKRKAKVLPKALVISAKSTATYADIIKMIKGDLRDDEVAGTIEKIRRTANDRLLVVLSRNSGDKLELVKSRVANVLGEIADVVGKTREVELSIRDVEETTTTQEVKKALQHAAGGEYTIPENAVRSLRPAYRGTQIASVRLPEEAARKVINDRGKIRIGLVNCTIREVSRPLKCYKCWHAGHIATNCPSQIDRTVLCMKCGKRGHKIAECKNDPHCVLCAEREKEDCKHIVGSYKCAVFNVKRKTTTQTRK